MIAEFFYPKELKELIAELRAKGDINETALAILNNRPYLFFLMLFALLIIILPSSSFLGGAFLTLFIALLWIFCVWYTIKKDFYNNMASYVFGHKKDGVVLNKIRCWNGHSRGQDQIKVEIFDIKNECILRTGSFSTQFSELLPEINEKIEFYKSTNQAHSPMPDIKNLKALYCLSKKIAES